MSQVCVVSQLLFFFIQFYYSYYPRGAWRSICYSNRAPQRAIRPSYVVYGVAAHGRSVVTMKLACRPRNNGAPVLAGVRETNRMLGTSPTAPGDPFVPPGPRLTDRRLPICSRR